MARARNIKPGFFKNEILVEQSLFVRLLFIGLWTLADREGRIEDRPKRIRLELFPYDDEDVDAALAILAREKFIERYEAGGVKVIQIVNFLKHQTPHGTEKDSELPAQDGSFTVCERKNGYANGTKRANNVNSNGNNVDLTFGARAVHVGSPLDNALNPDSLNPDSLNHEKKKSRKSAPPPLPCPSDVDQQVWKDWLDLRKKHKADVTQTVLDGAIEEAKKANLTLEKFLRVWCLRGSRGLLASWLKPNERGFAQPMSFQERDAQIGRKRWEEMTGQVHPDNQQSMVLDIFTPTLEIGHEQSN